MFSFVIIPFSSHFRFYLSSFFLSPNVAANLLLLHIREVPGSDVGPETGCPD
jgi:hypothetical protein